MIDNERIDAGEIRLLSKLFCYPEKIPEPYDLERVGITWGRGFGEDELVALQSEYVRLFINALPEVPCPPYGSVYLEDTLMGESTIRLQKLYQKYGVVADDMPDHIAVELEFLALLSFLSEEQPVEEDYRFLLNHLRQWTPEFLSRVEENDTTGFYRDLSSHAGRLLNQSDG